MSPSTFARTVVERLRRSGYEAVFAGGCVRDQLMGVTPKDFDVATNATPAEVRQVFGRRGTVPVGEAFGVMLVVGPRTAGSVEVATFRQDLGYSDGRRPDAVQYRSICEDALRRDFTINALYFDPISEEVIDFVGGQADLRSGIIRAVGDPGQRFSEDRLRMLRAVRFATTLAFRLDEATAAAIADQAATIREISAERIAAEMRRILGHSRRGEGLRLLRETRLLPEIVPELGPTSRTLPQWERLVEAAAALRSAEFTAGLALLLIVALPTTGRRLEDLITAISHRWKLTRSETKTVRWMGAQVALVERARSVPWPALQRILVHPQADLLVDLAEALNPSHSGDPDVAFCRVRLAWPPEQLNPPELLTGDALVARGLRPGPRFRTLLDAVRDAQLEGKIHSAAEAWQLIEDMQHGNP